ncbi:MAG: helix-turn-helix domain-containing protein [Gloeomargaritaceae cyanobacterium C42_A2020_066]|nr:helix-turn-helix domain-containing protein [Gloeomargaritaceae cyanobacterium C42_A2020_066]
MPEKLLTMDEAGQLLGVPGRTVKKWRLEGRLIPGVHYAKLGERTFRYKPDALMAWAMGNERRRGRPPKQMT